MLIIAWDEPSRFTDLDAGITAADMYAAVGPDGDSDDGDGETDDCPTPVVIVSPWRPGGADDAEEARHDARRRAEWDAGFADGRRGERYGAACPVPSREYGDGYDAGASVLARVEAAALADYGAWLTLPERDAVGRLSQFFGVIEYDGRNATMRNMKAHHLRWWVERLGLGHLPATECAFGGGLVVTVRAA